MSGVWSEGVEAETAALSVTSERSHSANYSWRRGAIGTLVFAFGLFIYTRVQLLAEPHWSFELGVDRQIPFVPEAILVYALFFFFVPVAAFVANRDRYRQLLVAAVFAALVGWVCFLLVPASFARPGLSAIGTATIRDGFDLLYLVDDSHNTFPSLHVAITWIACLGFRGTRLFWPAMLAALAICAATVFVKQHTVLDVFGGTVLAVLSLKITLRSRLAERLPVSWV